MKSIPSIAVALALNAFVHHSVDAANLKVPKDFPTIQAAIDAAGPGDVVAISSGTYDEHLDVIGKTGVTLKGLGSVKLLTSQPGDQITVGFSQGIRIEGLRLKNSQEDGIYVAVSADVTIANCSIEQPVAIGILSASVEGLVIDQTKVKKSGGAGIRLQGTSGAVVRRCQVEMTGSTGIHVYGSFNTVEDCDVLEAGTSGLAFGDAGGVITTSQCLAIDNRIKGTGNEGIFLTGPTFGCSLIDNDVRGTADDGIDLEEDTSLVVVDGNTIRDTGSIGIENSADYCEFSRNKVRSSLFDGLWVGLASSNGYYYKNNIKNNLRDGVHVNGTDNSFVCNRVTNNVELDLNDATNPGDNLFVENVIGTSN